MLCLKANLNLHDYLRFCGLAKDLPKYEFSKTLMLEKPWICEKSSNEDVFYSFHVLHHRCEGGIQTRQYAKVRTTGSLVQHTPFSSNIKQNRAFYGPNRQKGIFLGPVMDF